MILLIDIGNSNIVLSIFKEEKWSHTFRYETKGVKHEVYYEAALRQILMEWNILSKDISHGVISSVVPDLNLVVGEAIDAVLGCPILFLNPEVFKKLDMKVPHPYEIGADLVANAYGALKLYGNQVIVADFGTALSFVVADLQAGIQGVTIAPGLKTAAQALSDHTAQLPVVPLHYPDSVIGYDTLTAIQAGIMYGYVGLFKEIITEMKLELGNHYKVIITGGQAAVVSKIHTFANVVNKNLTVEGMRLISEYMIRTYPEDFKHN